MGVVSALRSVVGSRPTDSREPGQSDAKQDAPRTNLFECPSCGTVYVAVEQARCSSCNVAVDPVAAFDSR